MNKKIYLAGGCFWGVEAYFKKIKGIVKTACCYVNGKSLNTTYDDLKKTDHAEAVEITYDEMVINLAEILQRFYLIIDPVSINKQGNDCGRQYRSGIYYIDDYSYNVASVSLQFLQKQYSNKIAIELKELKNLVKAEDFHQDYLFKNPGGYCHVDISKTNINLSKQRSLSEKEISDLNIDDLSLDVLLKQKTESPFSSKYTNFDEVGIYVDKISKQALFSSEDKFDSGCGWPSFSKPITTDSLIYTQDLSHGMDRTEVKSSIQNAHLGHVFDDGPKQLGGNRYCINGASLIFIPLEEMKQYGYEQYLPYFKEFVLRNKKI